MSERVLTIKQPWADLIMAGVKDVENRTWQVPSTLPQWGRNAKDGTRVMPGGWGPGKHDAVFGAYEPDGPFPFRLWIHAAKVPDTRRVAYQAAEQLPADVAWSPAPNRDRCGVLLGSVTVTGCHHAVDCLGRSLQKDSPELRHCSRWAEPDVHHWTLEDPRPLDVPVPIRGHQWLWDLSWHLEKTPALKSLTWPTGELTGEELRDGCELRGHPMMGNACPCGKALDRRDL